jgi:hypothetical protein
MLDDATVKQLLTAYHEATREEEGTPTPLMILHGLREELTIRPHIELPSAYHMAHYLHEFVGERTIGITVCGRFFKQIGEKVFQGTLLYHVDRIGSHLVRGIDAKTSLYTVLDDSPYWNKFPYDFDEGPQDPDLPIGYHPGPEFDEAEAATAGEGGEGAGKAGAKLAADGADDEDDDEDDEPGR